jgi:hypothetical protein
MNHCLVYLTVAMLAGSLLAAAPPVSCLDSQRQDQEKQYTIAEVMKLAHKDGLLKKVATGKANDEEKKLLVTLYKSMAGNKPPRGDEESWKEKTVLLVAAAESAQKAEEGFADKLVKATDCKSCHDEHK